MAAVDVAVIGLGAMGGAALCHLAKRGKREQFLEIWRAAQNEPLVENVALLPRAAIPYLDEPWYC